MRLEYRELRRTQLDRSLEPFTATLSVSRPKLGWLRAVREALGISRVEVARKLRKTPQTVAWFERSEESDGITLRALRGYAEALDCRLVYALVPQAGSLQKQAESRAREQAEAIVMAVEHSMALEDQATGETNETIDRETDRILGR
jgi:predicted DNA-binding mobile mystery protein A